MFFARKPPIWQKKSFQKSLGKTCRSFAMG